MRAGIDSFREPPCIQYVHCRPSSLLPLSWFQRTELLKYTSFTLPLAALVALLPSLSGQAKNSTKAVTDRKVIVIFGDSISAGYGLNRGESFPDRLQKRLDDDQLP